MDAPDSDSTKKHVLEQLYDNIWESWENIMRSPVQIKELEDSKDYTRHRFYLVFSKSEWNTYKSMTKIQYLSQYLWADVYIDGICLTEINDHIIFDLQLDKTNKKL